MPSRRIRKSPETVSTGIEICRWTHVMQEDPPSPTMTFQDAIEKVAEMEKFGQVHSKGTAMQISTSSIFGRRSTEFEISLDFGHPSIHQTALTPLAKRWRIQHRRKTFKKRFASLTSRSAGRPRCSTMLEFPDNADGNGQPEIIVHYAFPDNSQWYMHLTPCPSLDTHPRNHTQKDDDGKTGDGGGWDCDSDSDLDVVLDEDIILDSKSEESGGSHSDDTERSAASYRKDGTVWNLAVYSTRVGLRNNRMTKMHNSISAGETRHWSETHHWNHVMTHDEASHDPLHFAEAMEQVAELYLQGKTFIRGTAKQLSTSNSCGTRRTEFKVDLDYGHPLIESRSQKGLIRKRHTIKNHFRMFGDNSLEDFPRVSTAVKSDDFNIGKSSPQMIVKYKFGRTSFWYMHLTPHVPPGQSPRSPTPAQSDREMEYEVDLGSTKTRTSNRTDTGAAGAYIDSESEVVLDEGIITDAAVAETNSVAKVDLDLPKNIMHNDESVYWKDGTLWDLAIYNNMMGGGRGGKAHGRFGQDVKSKANKKASSYDSEDSYSD